MKLDRELVLYVVFGAFTFLVNIVTYFHPWEFYELGDHPEFRISYVIRKNSGKNMAKRLDNLIKTLKKDHKFITYSEFADSVLKDNEL